MTSTTASVLAFGLMVTSILFVIVRAAKERGFWRLLFVLMLASMALSIVGAIFSRGSADTPIYLMVSEAFLLVAGVFLTAYRYRIGPVFYGLSTILNAFSDGLNPSLPSPASAVCGDLTFAVDGAVTLLGWLLLFTDVLPSAKSRRIQATF